MRCDNERYPFERNPDPERLRGKLVYDPKKCSGCQLCVKDCPADALELVVIDKVNKRFVLRYHADRCCFCAQCIESCRFKCLEMSAELWELAGTSKDAFVVHYGQKEDVQTALARYASSADRED
jgi:formate hydrogenlyase subunit 6/NADH:ubiquinone oxidoreductase subunit I